MATLTGNEKIAARNIRHCINWIAGGYYNYLQDMEEEEAMKYLPKTREDFEKEIYDSCINNYYTPGCERFGKAPREMRFAGESFIRAMIKRMMLTNGDVEEIGAVMGW